MLERAETVGTAVGAPKQGPGSRGYLLAPVEKREQELGTTPPPQPAYADRSGEAGRRVSGHKDEQERQGRAGRSS